MQKQKPIHQKRFNTVRRGRVSSRREARQHLVLRNNLEKRFYKRLRTLFRKFVRVEMHLYTQYGIYEPTVAIQHLNEDLFPMCLSHYKKIYQTTYQLNEKIIFGEQKQTWQDDVEVPEGFVFGRSVNFDLLVSNYFQTRVLYLNGITNRMASAISSYIQQGQLQGLSSRQIARELAAHFDVMTPFRAQLIARTETHNASSFAHHLYNTKVKEDTGMPMKKKWVAVSDSRTREAHRLVNGQIRDIDDTFSVGGMRMKHCGDPAGGAANVINCRCVTVYAHEDDIL